MRIEKGKEMMKLNTIEEALADLARGKMVIVVDDEKRENEGDIVIGAQSVTPEIINTMIKMSSGLICVPLAQEIAQKIGLELMVHHNTAHFGVNFSISIDAAQGITTGASAADKVVTIKAMTHPDVSAKDFVRPGHIFPLIAKKGGVLKRAGHTEAAVDLARLAGLMPIAVISEITNEDGSMARLPQLFQIAQKMDLKVVSIEDLINYRHRKEQIIYETTQVSLPTNQGNFTLHMFENTIDEPVCFALTKGTLTTGPVLTRIHSECFTGDVFGSLRCDCGNQLEMAMGLLEQEKSGVLIYLKQEGRGIGLLNKIKAYKIQEQGFDTVEANHQLGFTNDLRNYAMASHVLRYLQIKSVKLLTNNPHKMSNLESYGIHVTDRVPLEGAVQKNNYDYLKAKKQKMGHILTNV